ncbi:hypothetical protein [Alkalihalobacillus deserti]|uniref:hypothetical protein n=1 Tax=Alkalihalobacillus deserti TaxID=2879466 RepID=UPI001D14F14C|nr:hypothetical protein [Alkalihalobacillus deserti]
MSVTDITGIENAVKEMVEKIQSVTNHLSSMSASSQEMSASGTASPFITTAHTRFPPV